MGPTGTAMTCTRPRVCPGRGGRWARERRFNERRADAFPTNADVIRSLIEQHAEGVTFQRGCGVVERDADGGLRPLIQHAYDDPEGSGRRLFEDLPVIPLGRGDPDAEPRRVPRSPIADGDTVLCLVATQDVGTWRRSTDANVVTPRDTRRNHIGSAVALAGFYRHGNTCGSEREGSGRRRRLRHRPRLRRRRRHPALMKARRRSRRGARHGGSAPRRSGSAGRPPRNRRWRPLPTRSCRRSKPDRRMDTDRDGRRGGAQGADHLVVPGYDGSGEGEGDMIASPPSIEQ